MVVVSRRSKLVVVFVLIFLLVDLGPIFGQAAKTFTGKITEIARGTELDVARHAKFFVVRLEEYPRAQFRLSQDDAERYGLIAPGGPTGVVTPKMSKGIGWRVRLTCEGNYAGTRKAPTYRVTSLEKLSN